MARLRSPLRSHTPDPVPQNTNSDSSLNEIGVRIPNGDELIRLDIIVILVNDPLLKIGSPRLRHLGQHQLHPLMRCDVRESAQSLHLREETVFVRCNHLVARHLVTPLPASARILATALRSGDFFL